MDETSESQAPAESVVEESQPTIEDIANEFKVEEQINDFQAQPTQRQQEQSFVPDPFVQPDEWTQYTRQQAEGINQLTGVVQSLQEKIQSYESNLAQQKVEADVNAAVAKVNEKLNVDPMMAEVALEMEYRRDPAFKKVWDNRSQNPKAFDKALEVIANKFADKFAVRQDPQLTQNQLAAKKSLQTMGTTPPEDGLSSWESLSQSEFEAKWEQLRRGS